MVISQRDLGNKIGLLLLYAFLSGYQCEICSEPETISPAAMSLRMHPKAIPLGQQEAGYYEEDFVAYDAASCIVSCCEKPLCNIALYTAEKCFMIECDENNENGCDPIVQTADMYADTLFMQIRSLNETKAVDECSSSEECGDHESCTLNAHLVKRCLCNPGYARTKRNKTCSEVGSTVSTECYYGNTVCGETQHCIIPEGLKSQVGTCQCMNGFPAHKMGTCLLDNVKNIHGGHGGNTVSWSTQTVTSLPQSVTETPKDMIYTTQLVPKATNVPPVARAGDDQVIQLPMKYVTIDGSLSTDIDRITEFHWVRDSSSPAAGDVLNNTDHMAVLQLVNLVAGRYVFTLTVIDSKGLSSSDQAVVIVKDDEHKNDLMELSLDVEITNFSEENKTNLGDQLTLLLPKFTDEVQWDTIIKIQNIEDLPAGNLRVLFYATNVLRDRKVYRSGVDTTGILKQRLLSSPNVLGYKVLNIDTKVCQNNCSGHGHCNLRTKLCVCDALWTANYFRTWTTGDSNCDWSVLSVVIICFLIVIFFAGALWGIICCWKKGRRCLCHQCPCHSKKHHRYSLLIDDYDDDENDEFVEPEIEKKGRIQCSSVMISESDHSSGEEDISFITPKINKGHIGKSGLNISLVNMPLTT